jgi:hypothetical protein
MIFFTCLSPPFLFAPDLDFSSWAKSIREKRVCKALGLGWFAPVIYYFSATCRWEGVAMRFGTFGPYEIPVDEYWNIYRGSSGPAINFLETYLIGLALRANKNLLNKSDTKLYREVVFPGFLNSFPGSPGGPAKDSEKH